MRKIAKSTEPAELRQWKQDHPHLTRYANLNGKNATIAVKAQGTKVIDAIRTQNLTDQHFLCAYCCCDIRDDKISAMNEHVEARDINHTRELDFTNIMASCTTKGQCDSAHGNQLLPLTPFMIACETELKFRFSGKVEGLTGRAKEAIKVLNLGDERNNNRSLIERRKLALEVILLDQGITTPEELNDLEDFLADILAQINTPVAGKLAPFAPVLTNILRNMI